MDGRDWGDQDRASAIMNSIAKVNATWGIVLEAIFQSSDVDWQTRGDGSGIVWVNGTGIELPTEAMQHMVRSMQAWGVTLK